MLQRLLFWRHLGAAETLQQGDAAFEAIWQNEGLLIMVPIGEG
jgi:hypothetical protein